MPHAVSIKDIAKATGFCESTVSYALRNHPKISTATRKKIHKAADQLGYRPDPSLRSLMCHMRKGQNREIQQALAFLNTTPFKHYAEVGIRFRKMWEAMTKQAETLGYHLDEIRVPELLKQGKDIGSILYNRNIQGVVVHLYQNFSAPLDLPWDRLTSICLEREPSECRMDNISHSTFRGMQLAIRELKRRGYRRIGLAVDNPQQALEREQWIAGYLYELHCDPELELLPIYTGDVIDVEQHRQGWGSHFKPGTRILLPAGTRTWRLKHAPDCILTHNRHMPSWLQEDGVSIPDDLGIALLGIEPEFGDIAGVDQQVEAIARSTIQQIVARVEANEYGLPEVARHIRMEGIWRDGATVRPAVPSSTCSHDLSPPVLDGCL